jgi:hypothetical protein
MSQAVKLSDALVLDARVAGEVVERSIAGQVEFWARLGRSVEVLLEGRQVMQLCQSGAGTELSESLRTVDSPNGRQRVASYVETLPFPHYKPHATRRGLLERTEADGTRTVGRFIHRRFEVVPLAKAGAAE